MLRVLEKEMQKHKFSFKSDMGTVKLNGLEVYNAMIPYMRTDAMDNKINRICIVDLDNMCYMFNQNLKVRKEAGKFIVSLKAHCMMTVVPYYLGDMDIAVADSESEVAEYLRDFWCLPVSKHYSKTPRTIAELNTWLKQHGGNGQLAVKEENKQLVIYQKRDERNEAAGKHELELLNCKNMREVCERLIYLYPYLVRTWNKDETLEEEDSRFKTEREKYLAYKKQLDAEPKSVEEAYSRLPDKGKSLTVALQTMQRINTGVAFKRADNKYEISFCNGNNMTLSSAQLKEYIKDGRLNIVNLQIDRAGRMTKKAVNLKNYVRESSGYAPLEVNEQYLLIVYGIAAIEAMDAQKKNALLGYIQRKYGMDAEDIARFVVDAPRITFEWYGYLDTMCRDRVMGLIKELAKVNG